MSHFLFLFFHCNNISNNFNSWFPVTWNHQLMKDKVLFSLFRKVNDSTTKINISMRSFPHWFTVPVNIQHHELQQWRLTLWKVKRFYWDRIWCLIDSWTLACGSCFCGSGPVAALAGVPVDETGLTVVQVCVSLEALEVGGLISRVLIKAIGEAPAEVSHGVPGSGGGWSCGGLWGEACSQTLGKKCYKQKKQRQYQPKLGNTWIDSSIC